MSYNKSLMETKNKRIACFYKVKQKIIDLVNEYAHLPKQGSNEWLQGRKYTIGGSEIPTILEQNIYSCVGKLIKTKLGIENFNGNLYTVWGTLFEEVATDIIKKGTSSTVFELGAFPGDITHHKFSPDGLATIKIDVEEHSHEMIKQLDLKQNLRGVVYMNALFEIKSPFNRSTKRLIPDHYLSQVQSGLYNFRDVTSIGIFSDFLFRCCSLKDFEDNGAYEKKLFNNKKSFGSPICVGFILIDDGKSRDLSDFPDDLPTKERNERFKNVIEEMIISQKEIYSFPLDFDCSFNVYYTDTLSKFIKKIDEKSTTFQHVKQEFNKKRGTKSFFLWKLFQASFIEEHVDMNFAKKHKLQEKINKVINFIKDTEKIPDKNQQLELIKKFKL